MNVSPASTRIGWIGTGVMGRSMAGHLLDAGYALTIFTRSQAKANPLLQRGARWADSPKLVAAQSDIVFSIVGHPADVREVILGDQGVLAGAKVGAVLVDMTTSEPALAIEIAKTAQQQGVVSIDAPVSGGDIGAREARLSIMIGGDEPTVTALAPLWKLLGATHVRQGGPGAGQHTKMVNQTLVAGQMVSVCESMLYAVSAGLDPESVLKSVATGAAGSWSLSNLAPRMIAGNFEPGFSIEHFLKDMRIALSEAHRLGISLPGLALVNELYQAAAAQGHAKDGTHALILALARLSGRQWSHEE
ncbi:MAG: NAD(P)-dependent oxidoreductase [Planctomycetales bacterium]|nr:NAD(P)-dependent oxidoreductase [Planctomycetales bacterium]